MYRDQRVLNENPGLCARQHEPGLICMLPDGHRPLGRLRWKEERLSLLLGTALERVNRGHDMHQVYDNTMPEMRELLHSMDLVEAWDEGFVAGSEWIAVGERGIPYDPPQNPYRDPLT